MTSKEILDQLVLLASNDVKNKKLSKFGIDCPDSLGIYQKDINELVKNVGKNHDLGLELINSGVYEARILASKIMNPKLITLNQVKQWIQFFNTWEIVDTFSMKLFSKSPLAEQIIELTSDLLEEYQKRVAFATLSSYCMANKRGKNQVFESYLDLIQKNLDDDRIYVKKAVNSALRSIGKRNTDLNKLVLSKSSTWLEMHASKSAQWILKDAIKELRDPNVRISQYP